MTVKIAVFDRLNRPVEGAMVRVNWSGSHSYERTDRSGIADLRCSAGVCKRISIDDRVVYEGDFSLRDGINPFSHPTK